MSESLKTAVRCLDAQLMHMCGKASTQASHLPSSDVHTEVHEATPERATLPARFASAAVDPSVGDQEERHERQGGDNEDNEEVRCSQKSAVGILACVTIAIADL